MNRFTQQLSDAHPLARKIIAHAPDKEIHKGVKDPCPAEGQADYVQLEIRADTLHSLIKNRALFVEDIKGLNRHGKQWVKQVLLNSLLRAAHQTHQ